MGFVLQVHAPIYKLVFTNLGGEKRFAGTLAPQLPACIPIALFSLKLMNQCDQLDRRPTEHIIDFAVSLPAARLPCSAEFGILQSCHA